jgi:hypothetical protein
MSESLSHRLILPSARFTGRALDLLAPFDFDGRRGIMVQMKNVDQPREKSRPHPDLFGYDRWNQQPNSDVLCANSTFIAQLAHTNVICT